MSPFDVPLDTFCVGMQASSASATVRVQDLLSTASEKQGEGEAYSELATVQLSASRLAFSNLPHLGVCKARSTQ
jgi:hypothetical protein